LKFLFSRISYWCDLMFYYRRSTRILRLHGWMVYWFLCRKESLALCTCRYILLNTHFICHQCN
jgi:hypothetical protein